MLREQADDALYILFQAAAATSKFTAELWNSMSSNPDLRNKLSEFVILSNVVSVQVPGSV